MTSDVAIRFLIVLAAEDGDEVINGDVRIARLAPPYYLFKDLPAEVVLATPSGGFPSMSLEASRDEPIDPLSARFVGDRTARDDLAETLGLDQIVVEDFDALFCIGFAGSIWAETNVGVVPVIKSFLAEGKPIALVPGKKIDLAPEGAGAGLIIIGDSKESPSIAAHALISTVEERRKSAVTASP